VRHKWSVQPTEILLLWLTPTAITQKPKLSLRQQYHVITDRRCCIERMNAKANICQQVSCKAINIPAQCYIIKNHRILMKSFIARFTCVYACYSTVINQKIFLLIRKAVGPKPRLTRIRCCKCLYEQSRGERVLFSTRICFDARTHAPNPFCQFSIFQSLTPRSSKFYRNAVCACVLENLPHSPLSYVIV